MSPDAVSDQSRGPARDHVHRRGAPYGFRPYHLVVAAVVLVAWFSVLGFVITDGRGQGSSVDVYSELPAGFTGALKTQGVTYEGLSPVDASTQSAALAHVAEAGNADGGKPLVFRTSFIQAKGAGQPSAATPALMIVVPDAAGTDVRVDFLDPVSYADLKSVELGGAGPSAPASTGG